MHQKNLVQSIWMKKNDIFPLTSKINDNFTIIQDIHYDILELINNMAVVTC